MKRKVRNVGLYLLLLVWAGLAALAWVKPADDLSLSERRPLAQLPEISAENVLSGQYMTDFEDYATDQFPGRDLFRKLKAIYHYNVAQRLDNNSIYIEDGYAAQLEYPLNADAVEHALDRLQWVTNKYLADCNVYCAVIPDKGYYLAEENGYPAMDYEALFSQVTAALPNATHITLTDCLSIEDYYRTDTHWRQEKLIPAATRLCEAMGISAPTGLTQTKLDVDFYGVYYGQAALPMEPEDMYILESDLLKDCQVFNYETGKYGSVYDLEKLTGKDPYEVYLSGPRTLLRIENPNATTDKELIVFRDSFGSSMVPLLVQDYKTVTLVDIRYINSWQLEHLIEFTNQDVLFLYSTLVLNNGTQLK